MYALEQFLTRI